jgi:isochorismate pyruvate lyase
VSTPRQDGALALVSIPMNPDSYGTMEQVRAGVDAIDRQLVALLAERFAHMRAAARIKPDRGAVRDEARKAQVIANARAEAERLGAPGDVVAALWDQLVEGSIAYEMVEFDRLRADQFPSLPVDRVEPNRDQA